MQAACSCLNEHVTCHRHSSKEKGVLVFGMCMLDNHYTGMAGPAQAMSRRATEGCLVISDGRVSGCRGDSPGPGSEVIMGVGVGCSQIVGIERKVTQERLLLFRELEILSKFNSRTPATSASD